MGKKAKLKQIKKIAAQMPVIHTMAYKTEKVKGCDIEPEDAKKAAETGLEIEPGKTYVRKTPVAMPVNHARSMKKLYYKHGHAGVVGYINAVKDHINKQQPAVNSQP